MEPHRFPCVNRKKVLWSHPCRTRFAIGADGNGSPLCLTGERHMALFEKKDEPVQVPTTSRGDKLNTVIGKDSVFDGKLNVTGTLRIDGKVTGEINVSDTINIGNTGEVEASIKTKNAIIAGTIRGNIHATEKTELQAKSVIYGDIVTKSLAIEQGSVFQGHCNMGDIKERDLPQSSTPSTPTPKETASSAEKKR